MGEFLGHVGSDEEWICQNFGTINTNSKLLRGFNSTNNWVLVKTDETKTSGLYTRSAGGFFTILDYTISAQDTFQWINQLIIDEKGTQFQGSDHSCLTLTSNIKRDKASSAGETGGKYIIPLDTDYKEFQLKLNKLINKVSWKNLSLNEKCVNLKKVLIDAGTAIFMKYQGDHRRKKQPNISRSLRKLQDERKLEKITRRES